MPTGYTAGIADGKITTLRQYALTCARAFGALIEMRDEPLSSPIPRKIEPTDYHAKIIEDCEEALAKAISMTPEQRDVAAQEEFQEALEDYENQIRKNARVTAAYAKIKQQTEEWLLPVDLSSLRSFMLQQIEVSTEYSGWVPEQPVLLSGLEWFQKHVAHLESEIAYAKVQNANEIARAAEKNAWLAKLWAALPPEGEEG